MASFTLLFEGEVRGSMGGVTFSRNRFGQYKRVRAVPVNPNSSRQQGARNRFTALTELWSGTLTEAQRISWNDYAAAVPVTNRLGQSIFLTGFNHYVRSNTQQLQALAARIDSGPIVLTLPGSDAEFTATISEATQDISVVFDDGLDWVGEDGAFMQISMTKPVGAGRTYLEGPARFADSIDGDGTTPPTSPATVTAPFVVSESQKVIVKARIGRADGRLSDEFQFSVTIAA